MEASTPQRPFYQFCTQCGANALRPASDHEFVCPACGFRHFVNPITAVVGILTNDKGEILLIRRAHNPGRGMLGLPGGFVEVDESAEQALRREIIEETSLQVDKLAYFMSLPNRYLFQDLATPVLDFFYTAYLPNFDKAVANEEIMSIEPVHPKHFDQDQIAFPSNREALIQFIKIARQTYPD